MTKKRFQIALSFAGEHRVYVEQVANHLKAALVGEDAVFYDNWYTHELARPNLDSYLQNIYHQDSDLIVPFICADYERKDWCGLEWRAIRDLIKQRKDEDIMPMRFDNTHIAGLFGIDGYLDVSKRTAEDTATIILKRLALNNHAVKKN
jgi:hypothetical protein